MLMAYPEDAKNNTAIAKAVAGFGLLRYWHDTVNKARVVVKVNLKEDSDIPHGVLVTAGVRPRTRSWTCPVFALKHKDVVALPDEDPIPPNGPLFPLSYYAPRWMGDNRGTQDAGHASGGQSSVAQAPVVDAPIDDKTLFSLASLLPDQDGTMIGPQRPLVPYADDEEDSDEVQVLSSMPPASRKRKSRKLKEPLDERFLRRSTTLNKDKDGFHSQVDKVQAAAGAITIYHGSAAPSASASPAPHLTPAVIQGLFVGFLHVQPEAVSAAVLEELDA